MITGAFAGNVAFRCQKVQACALRMIFAMLAFLSELLLDQLHERRNVRRRDSVTVVGKVQKVYIERLHEEWGMHRRHLQTPKRQQLVRVQIKP